MQSGEKTKSIAFAQQFSIQTYRFGLFKCACVNLSRRCNAIRISHGLPIWIYIYIEIRANGVCVCSFFISLKNTNIFECLNEYIFDMPNISILAPCNLFNICDTLVN